MEENYYFNKLCWVCLNEEADMSSLSDKDKKIEIDNDHPPTSLYEMLKYVVNSNIFYIDGPYLICKSCIIQACGAYIFKKRCSLSLAIYKKCGLLACTDETYCTSDVSAQTLKEEEDELDKNGSSDTVKDEIKEELIKLESLSEEFEQSLFENSSIFEIVHEDSVAINNNEREVVSAPKKVRNHTKVLCNICGIERSRSGIKAHMLRHENVKNHTCPFCERKFNDKGNLKVHIRIHTGIHPYVCDICGKSFIQSTSLRTHKRVHDDVKPYKCNICSYASRTSSHLQLHIKRHQGVKNYHCLNCDYAACSKAELTYHLLTHSNDKPHICGVCGKRFARYKGLKIHEKSHTGEKPYLCELCNKRFTQAHSVRSHLRNVHKLSESTT